MSAAPDGSWINDVTLSSVARHHGLPCHRAGRGTAPSRRAARHCYAAALDRAPGPRREFLDGFITIETGNINYPVPPTRLRALRRSAQGAPLHRTARASCAQTVLNTSQPMDSSSAKAIRLRTSRRRMPPCRPWLQRGGVAARACAVRLAHQRQTCLEQTVAALRTHMEFMLPDGAWDNSWGTRNYKWSWWGSRTSDGCHPGSSCLPQHDPRFREAARRNFELMAACTHNGLLYGGPDYFVHGDLPCIHHSFTHAKALATVLDRGTMLSSQARLTLPRDEAYGLKSLSRDRHASRGRRRLARDCYRVRLGVRGAGAVWFRQWWRRSRQRRDAVAALSPRRSDRSAPPA